MNTRIASFLAVYTLSVVVLIVLEVLHLPYLVGVIVATVCAFGGMLARDHWWPANSRTRTWDHWWPANSPQCRALALLQSLCPDQFPDALARGYVVVASATHSGREYRVPFSAGQYGYARMVRVYEHGRHIAELCVEFHDAHLPAGDLAVARVLGLRADEDGFIKLGNWFPMPYVVSCDVGDERTSERNG